jgi:hypothetical protein
MPVLGDINIQGNVLSQTRQSDALNNGVSQEPQTPKMVFSNLEQEDGTIISYIPGTNESNAIHMEQTSNSDQHQQSSSQFEPTDPDENNENLAIEDIETSSEDEGNSSASDDTTDGLEPRGLKENHAEVQVHGSVPPSQRNIMIQACIVCCLYCVAGLRWVLSLFLSRQAIQTHKIHEIRFDKVVNSMVYWNHQQDVVPLNLVESRRIYDESVVRLAARDIVVAFMRGLLRRRKLLLGTKAAPNMEDESESNQKEKDCGV